MVVDQVWPNSCRLLVVRPFSAVGMCVYVCMCVAMCMCVAV